MPDHNPHPTDDAQGDASRDNSEPLGAIVKKPHDSEPPNEQSSRHDSNSAVTPKPSLPRRALARFIERWRDPYRNRPNIAEWLTVILTVVIAGVGFLQWLVYKQQTRIMGSDNPQTQKLIEAAGINACAARKSAQAARDFADTAALINGGIGNAVTKLDAQAKALDKARSASERQSSKALQATIANFHQEQRAWLGVNKPDGVPKDIGPYDVKIPVQNTGKTAAVDIGMYFGAQLVPRSGVAVTVPPFPGPRQPLGTIVPGGIYGFVYHQVNGLGGKLAAFPDAFFSIYGGITYKDVFLKEHWLTFCFIADREGNSHYCPVGNDIGDGTPPGAERK